MYSPRKCKSCNRTQIEVKVKVHSLKSDIYTIFNPPVTFPGIGHTQLKQSHLPWENTAHMSYKYAGSLSHCHNFRPPGTHCCWVGRGSMKWQVCQILLHMTSSANRTNPRPFDLPFNALSTHPCSSTYVSSICSNFYDILFQKNELKSFNLHCLITPGLTNNIQCHVWPYYIIFSNGSNQTSKHK